MVYNISFLTTADQAYESLDNSLRMRTEAKLEKIAGDEFRSPADWGYTQFDGQAASGKFDLFNSIRVFADIDEESKEIVIHRAYTRENLYR